MRKKWIHIRIFPSTSLSHAELRSAQVNERGGDILKNPDYSDIVAGLLNGQIVVRVPDDRNETRQFLVKLAEEAPHFRWNNGDQLDDFIPNQNERNFYFHIDSHRTSNGVRPHGGLMFDSLDYIKHALPDAQPMDINEFFHKQVDLSNILDELL